MRFGNAPKDILEIYWQKYSADWRKLSEDIRSMIEKNGGRITRIGYQPYKWLFILPLLMVTTGVLGLCAILLSFLFSQRLGSWCGVVWARINGFFTPMRVTVVGAENMEPGVSYVITANHQSLYDIYVLYGWLGQDFKWVMKKELEKVPVLGVACRVLGHIYIDRSDTKSAVETINAAKTKITGGTSVVFFPEGTRSADGKLKPFKKGAFRLAVNLGIPILPVTIIGTKKILPKGSLDLMPGDVTMIIHRPISVKPYDEDNLEELMEKTRRIISAPLE